MLLASGVFFSSPDLSFVLPLVGNTHHGDMHKVTLAELIGTASVMPSVRVFYQIYV